MAAGADDALSDGSWLVKLGISVKLEQSLQQEAGGSGVAFGHALIGQAGTAASEGAITRPSRRGRGLADPAPAGRPSSSDLASAP